MKRAPTTDELQTIINRLAHSLAVRRARITTRGTFRVVDEATGETLRGTGPALVLVVDEKMLNQGW